MLGQRGVPDSTIRARLTGEALAFLTNDTEFLERPARPSVVIVSRVRQDLPIDRRVEVWFEALTRFLKAPPPGDVFELLGSGEIVPWVVVGE